jgi:hypothetical protein
MLALTGKGGCAVSAQTRTPFAGQVFHCVPNFGQDFPAFVTSFVSVDSVQFLNPYLLFACKFHFLLSCFRLWRISSMLNFLVVGASTDEIGVVATSAGAYSKGNSGASLK